MTILASQASPPTFLDHLAHWPWSTIVATAGAVIVALLARSTQSKANSALDKATELSEEFSRDLKVIDNHFKVQSSLLDKVLTAFTDPPRSGDA